MSERQPPGVLPRWALVQLLCAFLAMLPGSIAIPLPVQVDQKLAPSSIAYQQRVDELETHKAILLQLLELQTIRDQLGNFIFAACTTIKTLPILRTIEFDALRLKLERTRTNTLAKTDNNYKHYADPRPTYTPTHMYDRIFTPIFTHTQNTKRHRRHPQLL